jgi:hypothetical protein
MKRFILISLTALLAAGVANADITKYTNATSWGTAAAGMGSVNTINWDDVDVPAGSAVAISGSRYSSMLGSPVLSVDAGSVLKVADPASDGSLFQMNFIPVSGENLFTPDGYVSGPTGILTVSFGLPAYALGAYFLDVETGYADTGIKVGSTPYAFTASQGNASQSFLGITSDVPFMTAQIYMGNSGDGVTIDDMKYVVPVPSAVLIGLLGLGAAGLKLRRSV